MTNLDIDSDLSFSVVRELPITVALFLLIVGLTMSDYVSVYIHAVKSMDPPNIGNQPNDVSEQYDFFPRCGGIKYFSASYLSVYKKQKQKDTEDQHHDQIGSRPLILFIVTPILLD